MSHREPVRPIQPEQQDEPTIGRLVADASRDISALVQSEIALAKSELVVSAKAGGVGAALFAVAGFIGLLVIILVSIAFAFLLSMTGLHPAWCFLIVAGAYVLLAGVLVLVGVRLMKKIRAPQKTIATAKQIPAALKGQHQGSGAARR
ncbi:MULTISPECIES: phage holin family protein [unclassified Aeromicrobium]|uniref:phage holin family protein n=1 Tax=unclassified Aeromicrobium TaxID=2633570 RepID=UPI0006FD752C|nr:MULTISPECIES: phage holin family protein [unclassified Aeromicrobium]KQO42177.1 hypothetical protein ASF05_14055 [Aeromicrobium sp. Leaf245]KQP29276.1 hypothetical protein ASF38_00395 [Aeromicrobium sp. Leaf272]KQP75564.1 hypothetical protein ASF37_15080 [Aeromicrobium sp. Leaf289]KQP81638.1 hypothetical protein ASF35_16545 [Aeromicrobium sp. Leaf291]